MIANTFLGYIPLCVGFAFWSNFPKREKKCKLPAFLPNAQCNLEKDSPVFLVLAIFSHFLEFFLVYQKRKENTRKNKKRKENHEEK